MPRTHAYETETTWTGNRGAGTADPRAYDRGYATTAAGRPTLHGSSDPAFRGDAERWNPELLLVAALSQCHMLWYLMLCATHDVVVTDYRDTAAGSMLESSDGGGRFDAVVLRPHVIVADAAMVARAEALHADASAKCFIANSVNFPVTHAPRVTVRA